MRKSREPRDTPGWDVEEFNKVLDEYSVAAGIPVTKGGLPNSVDFYEATGVKTSTRSRWRSGQAQPTTESLRLVDHGLTSLINDMVDEVDQPLRTGQLLARLEVLAGRRSEEEAEVTGGAPDPLEALSDAQIMARARRIAAMMDDPELEDEDLDEFEDLLDMHLVQIKKRRQRARERAAAEAADERRRPSA